MSAGSKVNRAGKVRLDTVSDSTSMRLDGPGKVLRRGSTCLDVRNSNRRVSIRRRQPVGLASDNRVNVRKVSVAASIDAND